MEEPLGSGSESRMWWVEQQDRLTGEAQEKEGRKDEKGGKVREIQNVRTQPTIAAFEDGRREP